ncbi:MAG TPA: NUDIX domain-containing protein [Candidatus Limnocylindria bacterium]|nr:NUDIX domain-containing protein [Candidatus Limnocylindria bacterium]
MSEERPGPDRQVTRVAAYTLCVEDDRVLLCRVAPGPWTAVGHWTLPGGGVDFGESPAAAALRELEEEAGLSGQLLGVADVLSWSDRWRHPGDGADEAYHAIQIVYRASVIGGTLRDELQGSTDRAGWFSIEELRDMPLVPLARVAVQMALGITLPGDEPAR